MAERFLPHIVHLAAGSDPQTPHHWAQGPQDVERLARPVYARSRKFGWRYRWYLGDVRGTSRTKAASRINDVLWHERSWERTGVIWVRTYTRSQAHIVVSVIPQDETVCGPGSAGCFSWGFRGDKPLAELGVEHIDNANGFAELVNMELCGHGTFAMHDMYLPGEGHAVNAYQGVMGTWNGARSTGYYPSDTEIADARAWLAGKAPYVHEH